MNIQNYFNQLKTALGTDLDGDDVSQDTLTLYMVGAVRTYSRYRALLRNFGEGGLAQNAPSGSSTITVVGGNFAPGNVITLDAYTPWSETATILSIARSPNALYVGTPLLVTLTAPTANVHYAGGIVAGPLGLTLVTGQSVYLLPNDFKEMEQESWSIAIGARSAIKKREGFYDGVYRYSEPIQGVDLGLAQNFLGGGPATAGAYIGLPGVPPNQVNVQSSLFQSYVINEGSPPTLTINPSPTQGGIVLQFQYWALHLPETVPDTDLDALIEYGKYLGLTARGGQAATRLTFAQGAIREDWHSTQLSLAKQAEIALAQWEALIVRRPIMVMG